MRGPAWRRSTAEDRTVPSEGEPELSRAAGTVTFGGPSRGRDEGGARRVVTALALCAVVAVAVLLPLVLPGSARPEAASASPMAIAEQASPAAATDATPLATAMPWTGPASLAPTEPPLSSQSPTATARATADNPGGGPDWSMVSVTYSARISADEAGWVKVANPPILVECYYNIPAPGVSISVDGTYIEPGGTQTATFRLPDTYSGSVDVQVTCRDPDWKWSKRWDLGNVVVDPANWSATMNGTASPGQLMVVARVSMNADCVLDYDLPSNGWPGFANKGQWHTKAIADSEYGWITAYSILWPGAARFVLTCIDGLHRSHTLKASFDVVPDPANTLPPYEPSVTPTPVVTPGPTPVVTPEPTPVVTPEPTPVVTPGPTPVVTPGPSDPPAT
jgi:hypothetical protein